MPRRLNPCICVVRSAFPAHLRLLALPHTNPLVLLHLLIPRARSHSPASLWASKCMQEAVKNDFEFRENSEDSSKAKGNEGPLQHLVKHSAHAQVLTKSPSLSQHVKKQLDQLRSSCQTAEQIKRACEPPGNSTRCVGVCVCVYVCVCLRVCCYKVFLHFAKN